MTYRVDLAEAARAADEARWRADESRGYAGHRNLAIRAAYRTGATLQQLADATGLTRQRIQQIVSERGER